MESKLPIIAKEILKGKRIALAGHTSPDGDSLGSILALALGLKQLGKEVFPLIQEEVPSKYQFMPGAQLLHRQPPEDIDMFITVDCGDEERLGDLKDFLKENIIIFNIDHHQGNTSFGDFNFHDANASATGELIYDLLKVLGVSINYEIALNLYTAIVTDTGSFNFANTTQKAHNIAGEMINLGIDPAFVAETVFRVKPLCELRLIGMALSELQVSKNGKYAWVSIPIDWFDETGCPVEASEGIVNYPRYLPGVQVGLVFREKEREVISVSFRSQENIDVSKLARNFGGGGHKQAAGCIIHGSLDMVKAKVLAEVEKLTQGMVEG